MDIKNVSGVYKITNPEGKIYIGSSSKLKSRIVKEYKNNKTQKIRLVNQSIIDYGFNNHIIEVVEYCERSMLTERERYWQEFYDCLYPKGLNRNYVACRGKGQFVPDVVKNLISERKIGTPAWNKGIPTCESTKKTIQERYTPLQRSTSKIILDTTTGVYFYCIREAAEAYNMPQMTLSNNLRAPNKDNKKNKTNLIIT